MAKKTSNSPSKKEENIRKEAEALRKNLIKRKLQEKNRKNKAEENKD